MNTQTDFKIVGENVILESVNGKITNHYTVEASIYYANDLAQFYFDEWLNSEVKGSFEHGYGIRSNIVRVVGGNVEEKAFTEKWLMRKSKKWLCALNNLLTENAYYVVDEMLKVDFVDNLLSVTKLELLEKAYKEDDFSFLPFWYEIAKVAGYSQGDVFIIINLDKNHEVDYDGMQNLAFSSPINGTVQIEDKNGNNILDCWVYDFCENQYDWHKDTFLQKFEEYLKTQNFDNGLIDCIKDIVSMKVPNSLNYI